MNGVTLSLIVSGLLAISGCDRGNRADNEILCHPTKLEAYTTRPGAGDTSFILRTESADSVCKLSLKGGGA